MYNLHPAFLQISGERLEPEIDDTNRIIEQFLRLHRRSECVLPWAPTWGAQMIRFLLRTAKVANRGLSLENLQQAMALNPTGAFLMSRAASPRLRATGGISKNLMASQMPRMAKAGQAAYCASKGALI